MSRRDTGLFFFLAGMALLGHSPARAEPPAEKLPRPVAENFGLDSAKIKAGRCTISGVEVERHHLFAALAEADARIPDVAGKLRLTVIGPPDVRKPVCDDLAAHPALAPWRDKAVVQCCDPANAWLRKCGLKTDGGPTLYVQSDKGQVLARNLDGKYRGAEALAKALERATARAKAPPAARSYDPGRDPDLWEAPPPPPAPAPDDKQPSPGPAPDWWSAMPWQPKAIAGGVVVLLLLLALRRSEK